MAKAPFSEEELREIRELFGKDLSEIQEDEFDQLLKQIRKKYHPDQFEQFANEVVKEMAKDKFQRVEALGQKVRLYLTGQLASLGAGEEQADIYRDEARFAFDDMKIEVVTRDKDLKYRLFGTRYRWLLKGDKFKIPKVEDAYLVVDGDHAGRSIGFNESIRMYLTFGEEADVNAMVEWLYHQIKQGADGLIIAGERIKVDLGQMQERIRRTSFLRLASGKVED